MRRAPLIGEPGYLIARGLAATLKRLSRAWSAVWTPQVPPDPVEWIEGGGVILPDSVGANGVGGRISFRAAPWWRVPLRWLGDRETEVILIGAGSQQGKTTWLIAASAYCLRWLPGPQTYAMPTDDHADRLVRERLRPIFRASPFAKGLKSENLRLGGATIPGGGTLNVTGIGSPSALKAHPAIAFWFDEYDEAIRKNVSLGSPFKRAEARTRTYGKRAKIVIVGTPIKEDKGITPLMETAKRYEWHVPCPHCGAYQRLFLGQLWWPRGADGVSSASSQDIIDRGLAKYECIECHKMWNEEERLVAIATGKEVCIDPDRPGRMKAFPQMSILYSPFVNMHKIAGAFLDALSDPDAMRQFQNEWMAEPTRDIIRTASTDQAHLAAKGYSGYEMPAPDWWRGQETPRAPDWVRAVTWGFDVQGSEAWGMAVGWGDHRESIILWSGKFAGANDLDDAASAFRRTWIVQGGEEVYPIRGMMDSGYRSHEVYRVCSRTPSLLASKGRQDGTLPMSMSQVDRQDGNRRTVGRVDLAVLWTTYWQDIVAAGLEQDPGRGRGATHLPMNPPAELYRHLCAERKKRVKRANGQVVEAWVAHDSQNHLRDCLVYATAAAGHSKRLDMMPRARQDAIPESPAPATPGETAQPTETTRPKPSGLAALAAARKAGTMGRAQEMRRL